jgi:hypothetical protein
MLAKGQVIAAGSLAEVRVNPDERVQAFFQRKLLPAAAGRSLADELEWRP